MDVTQFGGDADNRRRIVETSTRLFRALALCPAPVVAFVNGPALAGGFALALFCDVRIAAREATFGFVEVSRGIPASYAAARAALSEGVARDLCLTRPRRSTPARRSSSGVARPGSLRRRAGRPRAPWQRPPGARPRRARCSSPHGCRSSKPRSARFGTPSAVAIPTGHADEMGTMRAPDVRDVRLAEGRRLRVRSWPGEGRPLVLLHGLLDDSEGWTGLAIDTHRPCIAIDLPGFGGSDLPRWPRISAYAEDVAAGLQRARDRRVHARRPLARRRRRDRGRRAPRRRSTRSCCSRPRASATSASPSAFALPGVRDVAQLALPLALVSPLLVTAGYATFVAHGRLPSRDLTDRLRRRAFQSGPRRAQRRHRDRRRRPLPARLPHTAPSSSTARSPRSGASATRSSRSRTPRRCKAALPQAHVEVWPRHGPSPAARAPRAAVALHRAPRGRGAEAKRATRTRSARRG